MKASTLGATQRPSTSFEVMGFIAIGFVSQFRQLLWWLACCLIAGCRVGQVSCTWTQRWLLAWLLATCLGLPAAHAQILLTPHEPWPLLLRDSAQVYLDTSGQLDFDDISRLSDHDLYGFKSWFDYPQPLPLPGNTWWFHWNFVNSASSAETYRLILGSPLLQHVDWYVVRSTGVVHGRAGSAVPVSQRLLPSREPTAQLRLEPGEQASVYVRLQTARQLQLVPRLYTELAYGERELRAALWDAVLWGGLLALAWAGLMISLLARAGIFALMSVMCVCIVLFEAAYRGYAQLYLWPEALEWGYRSASVFGAASIALLPWFVLGIARYEKVDLPWTVALVVLGVAQAALAVMAVWAPYGLIGSVVSIGSNVFMIAALAIAIRLMLGTLISARLMVLVMAFAVFNIALRTAEAHGVAPDFVMRWGFDLHPNPVVALIGFGLNLTVLAAWVTYLADQRVKARDALIDWQLREKDRLEGEVQRQTRALRAALLDAEEKTRQKAQVLGYVSHDLRTPLAAIAGYSQVLFEASPAEQTRHLKAIDRAVNYQLQLIDELLEFSQEELQPLHIRPERTDLLELLRDVSDHAAGLAQRQNNHFIAVALSPFPRWIEVDPRRLQQVLLNLLANAAKFTRSGEIRLQVQGEVAAQGWHLRLAVSDSGIGIEAEQQKNVFQAFQQLQRAHGSVGLGLFIAQRIVDGMGGRLRLESQPGEGSVFSVEINVTQVGEETVASGVLQDDPRYAPERPVEGQLPPTGLRTELVMLARTGRLSDIESWIDEQREEHPQWEAFLSEVHDALRELDFEAIERAARLNEENE